jgi:hypothetical protein
MGGGNGADAARPLSVRVDHAGLQVDSPVPFEIVGFET